MDPTAVMQFTGDGLVDLRHELEDATRFDKEGTREYELAGCSGFWCCSNIGCWCRDWCLVFLYLEVMKHDGCM